MSWEKLQINSLHNTEKCIHKSKPPSSQEQFKKKSFWPSFYSEKMRWGRS